ncbi:MAG TPA: peptidoglycan DD-metalloendopeptidase family protein [Vicinamibacterales bacterium]|nr:peptidoglycan DD-metalloendopeptidase family protein [Vicinamibacterales bacterium]
MKLSRFVPVAGLVFCAALAAQAPDRARTEALARRASERLQSLQREADRLAADERTLLGDLRKLEVDRQIRREQLKQASADVSAVQAEIDATSDRMNHLQQQDQSERPDLRARLVETYKLGQARYLRLLLATSDVRRLGEATRAVAVMAKLDRDRIASHQRTLDELQSTRAALEGRRKKLEAVRADAARAQGAADRATQARNDLVHDIDQRRDLNAQWSGELQAAEQKLQLELRQMAAGSPASAGAGSTAALPLRPFRGDLDWPALGAVRHRFGTAAATGGQASNGIEIAADEGTPAQAVHDGVVAFADTFAGFGNLVIVDHGSQTFSLYGNLLDLAVAKGARVDRGEVVGHVGPSPTGPAGLYFELRVDGHAVDPLQWLKKK